MAKTYHSFSKQQIQEMLRLLPSEPLEPKAVDMNIWYWDSMRTTFPKLLETGYQLIISFREFVAHIDNLREFLTQKAQSNRPKLDTETICKLHFIKAMHLFNIQGLSNPTQLYNGILPALTYDELQQIWDNAGLNCQKNKTPLTN
ncbi:MULTISPECIES: hypothetical protein [unclassified Moraxella]|uniref:hypothetical protein n=1 Tax=unclassified Moraxella TaxID=2685852 RepID=UPI00359EDCC3